MDLGRHILAKGFGQPVTSYKEIAQGLEEKGVLSKELGVVMRKMAGYRTRMVHFYHEIGSKELFLYARTIWRRSKKFWTK
ncbi:MAG: hypothetical protein DRI91_06340 [Aquificota bacterium]|nr:MAG: hypothetical protein DRI91_06340 [Aquificota bacterium]